jgi:hypothetical protein
MQAAVIQRQERTVVPIPASISQHHLNSPERAFPKPESDYPAVKREDILSPRNGLPSQGVHPGFQRVLPAAK